jgi:hypothetical protein
MSIVTVITAAEETRLASLTTFKAEMGITGTDDDARLGELLDQASAIVVAYLDRALAYETVSELFRDDEIPLGPELYTDRWPLVSVSSVVVDGVTLDSSLYEVDGGYGTVFRLGTDGYRTNWQDGGTRKVVVQYSAGHKLPGEAGRSLPLDIERATLDIARGTYQSQRRDPSLKSMEVPGVLKEDYWVGEIGSTVGGVPSTVASSLDRYRRIVF